MLLQFSVKNFRSIKDWATLSMIPLNRLDRSDDLVSSNVFRLPSNKDVSVLKASVIYGKNASGKSNLILAIRALNYMIKSSDFYDEEQSIPSYEPYIFDKDTGDMPCQMEVDFVGTNGFRYTYEVSYMKDYVLSEKLVFFPKKQPALLFSRHHDLGTNKPVFEFGPQFKGDRRFTKEKNIMNKLLLSEFKGSDYLHTKEAYTFFSDIIVTSTRTNKGSADAHDVMNLNIITRTLGRMKQENEASYNDIVARIVLILKGADVGIEGLEVNKVESITADEEFVKDSYQVYTHHTYFENGKKAGVKKLSIFNESTGTIKLFGILNSILSGFSKGALIALDELDRSLHPKITRLIVRMFYNIKLDKYLEMNPNSHPQLIFTTHDSSLLDKELFRRDQIWFTDIDESMSTVIYCLAEVKGVRKDTPYSDWYLSGKFGAVPATTNVEI
jgi:AAA15 family ATPase/GTPase